MLLLLAGRSVLHRPVVASEKQGKRLEVVNS
jgi:hypothetical protein